MTKRLIFPDTSVAIDFAIVDRIDLLTGWLRGRGAVCEAVRLEILDNSNSLPSVDDLIAALGDPIELTEEEWGWAEDMRIVRLGGSSAKPREHLGEAHTIALIASRRDELGDATWIADDCDSREFAGEKGIRVMDFVSVLQEVIVEGEISVDDAWDLWQRCYGHERGGCRRPTNKDDLRT